MRQCWLVPFGKAGLVNCLPNNLTLKSCVVVNINDTEGSSCEATPDQLVVLAHVGRIQLTGRRGQRPGRDIRDSSSIQVVAVD